MTGGFCCNFCAMPPFSTSHGPVDALKGSIMRIALAASALVFVTSAILLAGAARGPAIESFGPPGEEAAAPAAFDWTAAEFVFTGKLVQVVAGPVGQSYPPMYTHTLHFTVEKVLRGALKAGEKVTCSHIARQLNEPRFPTQDQLCLVAGVRAQGSMQAERVEPSNPELLAQVTQACSIPLGWRVEGGKPVSPWAGLGKKAWAAQMEKADAKVVCSKTGRPALMVGEGVTFEVAPVPPKVAKEWTNPDGDGEYTLTVTNATDKPVTVPALLSAGGKILWEESLVILCQDKAYACPGAKGVTGKVEPTTLAPHQAAGTTVNVLLLQGPEWPQGGYRIEFRFCLGEKSRTQSLYYMTKHHGVLRDALLKPPAAEKPAAEKPAAEKPAVSAKD
jgi:hypothetical protein